MKIRVIKGLDSKWLIVGAMLRPSWTARDPFWLLLVGIVYTSSQDSLTGGQKSSCMSTMIRAGLMVPFAAILDLGVPKDMLGKDGACGFCRFDQFKGKNIRMPSLPLSESWSRRACIE